MHLEPPVGHRDVEDRAIEGVRDRRVELGPAVLPDRLERRGEVRAVVGQHRRPRAHLRAPGRGLGIDPEPVVEAPSADQAPDAQQLGHTLWIGELGQHGLPRTQAPGQLGPPGVPRWGTIPAAKPAPARLGVGLPPVGGVPLGRRVPLGRSRRATLDDRPATSHEYRAGPHHRPRPDHLALDLGVAEERGRRGIRARRLLRQPEVDEVAEIVGREAQAKADRALACRALSGIPTVAGTPRAWPAQPTAPTAGHPLWRAWRRRHRARRPQVAAVRGRARTCPTRWRQSRHRVRAVAPRRHAVSDSRTRPRSSA